MPSLLIVQMCPPLCIINTQVRVDVGEVDPPKKPRLEKQENRSSPITVQTSKDLLPNLNDYDETNADDFAMEMGLACVVCRYTVSPLVNRPIIRFHCRSFADCCVLRCLRQMTVTMGNQLVECQECHNLYHQDCHKPQVTDKEVNDPRLVWYCARCTRQMKRMVRTVRFTTTSIPHWVVHLFVVVPCCCFLVINTVLIVIFFPLQAQKPPQKPSPASASSAPVVKDTLVKKTELKAKPDTASTFQAFKRTEVKVCIHQWNSKMPYCLLEHFQLNQKQAFFLCICGSNDCATMCNYRVKNPVKHKI